MKNICFLIGNVNNSGGTERVTSMIANELSNQKYHVYMLSFFDGQDSFFKLVPNIKTYSLYSNEISLKSHFLGTVLKIRRFMKDKEIDTLVVVDSISCIFTVPALARMRINHICWEHFNFKVDLGNNFRNIARKLAAKYCDTVVTLTERDKKLWLEGINNIKTNIISISNPSPFKNVEHTPSLESKTILSIGRLTNQKGFDLLIEAWYQFCQSNTDWVLRIIGDGEDKAALKLQASSLGICENIDFVSSTKNIEYYYQTSSFYCLSSRYEGLPMVLLEAQAFGLPIISFDCDTGPSEVIDHNANGWLIPANNIEKLSDAFKKATTISSKNYEFLVQNSRNNDKFLIDSILTKWKTII